MNDIEKQIEESFNDSDVIKEDDTINKKFNYKNNNSGRRIMYIILGLLVVIIIFVIVYLMFNKKNNDEILDNDSKDITDNSVKMEDVNVGYVSCDDNTSLLNVRSSMMGDIIDGLSCFQSVVIEEEDSGKTDNCDKWYKVKYDKHDDNYTGYVCSDYIKKLEVNESVIDDIRSVIDKALVYHGKNILMPYCGDSSSSKVIKFNNGTGEYLKSEFKNLSDLRNYLLEFLDENIINSEGISLELSDYDNPKMGDNYYIIDDNLYCRGYSDKKYNTLYTGNYNIEVKSDDDGKIVVNVAYEYIKSSSSNDDKCNVSDLSFCVNSDFEYEIKRIIINKVNGKYVIYKMDFYE